MLGCFLFDLQAIRIYFWPYKYQDLHPKKNKKTHTLLFYKSCFTELNPKCKKTPTYCLDCSFMLDSLYHRSYNLTCTEETAKRGFPKNLLYSSRHPPHQVRLTLNLSGIPQNDHILKMAPFSSTVLHQLPVKRLPNIWFSDLLTVNVDAIHQRAVSSVWLAMLGLLWVRITVWNLINNQINLYSKWTPQRSWLLSLSSKGVWFMSILKYFYVRVCVCDVFLQWLWCACCVMLKWLNTAIIAGPTQVLWCPVALMPWVWSWWATFR